MLKVLLVTTTTICVCVAADSTSSNVLPSQPLPVRFSYSYGFQQRPTPVSKRSHDEFDEADESAPQSFSGKNNDQYYDEREDNIRNKVTRPIPYGVPLHIAPISASAHGLFALPSVLNYPHATLLTYPITSHDGTNALTQPSSLISSVLQPNSFAHFTYTQPLIDNGGARQPSNNNKQN